MTNKEEIFFIKRERRGLEYVQNKERRNNKVTK